MLITVIICTYRRAFETVRLLECLQRQSYADLEILVVDGSGDDRTVRDGLKQCISDCPEIILLESEKGLTRQRNVGLRKAKGDIIAFLDDDVTIEPDFFDRVAKIFADSNNSEMGGLTAYDTKNYPASVNLRWRLRKWLRVVATLEPGFADRLGRNVPLSFAKPFVGLQEVHWLAGFCMIYRRSMIEGLAFDEVLPTYGGEDRDFSMRVGDRSKLMLSGDLQLKHLASSVHRVTGTNQIFQTAFGIGRGFRKRARNGFDTVTVVTYAIREFLVEAIAGLRHPTLRSLLAPFARMQGLVAGWMSLRAYPATAGIVIENRCSSHDNIENEVAGAIR